MGDVDTTRREVEEHESKDNPHPDSAAASDLFTDDDARAATDGQIDAATLNGLKATEIKSSVDYVGPDEPADPSAGEEWFDTDRNAVFMFDGSTWHEETISDHRKLSGVQPGQHFDPGNALTFNGSVLDVLEGNIAASDLGGHPFGTDDLGFDPATQNELNSHAEDSAAHHAPAMSETDDGGDVEKYSASGGGGGRTTLVDISGSGVLLSATAFNDGSSAGGLYVTVDAGTEYQCGWKSSPAANMATLPPIQFESSLLIELAPAHNQSDATAWVKQ